MPCLLCASGNEREFAAEMMLHFSGPQYIDNPGVLAFPRVLVCLDCGQSRFTLLKTEKLALLSSPAGTRDLPGSSKVGIRESLSAWLEKFRGPNGSWTTVFSASLEKRLATPSLTVGSFTSVLVHRKAERRSKRATLHALQRRFSNFL